MLTKKDFCLHILDDFAINNGKKVGDIQEKDILSSSSLAVAMEWLGLLHDEEWKDYASSRGGTMIITRKAKYLSVRDLLELLPDEIIEVEMEE